MTITPKTKKRLWFAVGAALFVLILWQAGFSFAEFLTVITEISLAEISMVIAAGYVTMLLRSWRWGTIVKAVEPDTQFPRGFFFYYYSVSVLATHFVSQALGAQGVKASCLKVTSNVSLARGAYVVLLEHAMSFSVVLAAALPSILYLTKTLDAVTTGWLIVVLTAILCIIVTFFLGPTLGLLHWMTGLLLRLCGRIPRLKRFSSPESIDFDFIKTNFATNRWLAARLIIISVLIYYGLLGCYIIYGYALGLDLPILPFTLTFAGIYLVNAISPTPGALGFSELGWLGILGFIGIGSEQAALYIVGQRILNEVAVLSMLAPGYIYYSRCARKIEAYCNAEQ